MVVSTDFSGLTGSSMPLPKWEAYPFIAEVSIDIDFIYLNSDYDLGDEVSLFGLTGAGITGLAGLTADFSYSGVTATFSQSTLIAKNYACKVTARAAKTQIAQVTYGGVAIPGAVIIFIGADLYSTPTLDMTSVRNANIYRSSTAQANGSGHIPLAVLLRFDKAVQPTPSPYHARYWQESSTDDNVYVLGEAVGGLSIVLDVDINSRSSAYRGGYGMQLYAQIPNWTALGPSGPSGGNRLDFQYVVMASETVSLAPVFSVTNDVVLSSTVKDVIADTVLDVDTDGVYTTVFYPDFDGTTGPDGQNVLVAQFRVKGGKNAGSTYAVDVYEADGTNLGKQALNVSVSNDEGKEDTDGVDESTVSLYFDLSAGATSTTGARGADLYTDCTVTVTDDLNRTLNLQFKVIALANPELTLVYGSEVGYTGAAGVHAHQAAFGATGASFTVGTLVTAGNLLSEQIGSYPGVTLGALEISADLNDQNLLGLTGTMSELNLVYSSDFLGGLTASELYKDINITLTEHGRTFTDVIKYIKDSDSDTDTSSRPLVSGDDVQFYVFPETTVDSAIDIKENAVVFGTGLTGGYQVAYYPNFDSDIDDNKTGPTGIFGVLSFSLKGGMIGANGSFTATITGVTGGKGTVNLGVTGTAINVTATDGQGERYTNIGADTGTRLTVNVTNVFGAVTSLQVQVLALANPTATFVYDDEVFGTQTKSGSTRYRGRPLPGGTAAADFDNGGVLTNVVPIIYDSTYGYQIGGEAEPVGLTGAAGAPTKYVFNVATPLTEYHLAFSNDGTIFPSFTLIDNINVDVSENARSFSSILENDVQFYMYPQLEVSNVQDILSTSVEITDDDDAYPVLYYPVKDAEKKISGSYPVATFGVTGGLFSGGTYGNHLNLVSSETVSGVTAGNISAMITEAAPSLYTATLSYGATSATRNTSGSSSASSVVTFTVTCDFEGIADASASAVAATEKTLAFNVLALANPAATFYYDSESFKRTYDSVQARPWAHGTAIDDFTVGALTFNALLTDSVTGSVPSLTGVTGYGELELLQDAVTLKYIKGDSDRAPSYTKFVGINLTVAENSRDFLKVIVDNYNAITPNVKDVEFYVYPALQVCTTTVGRSSVSHLPCRPVAMHTTYGLGEYRLTGTAANAAPETLDGAGYNSYGPFSTVHDTDAQIEAIYPEGTTGNAADIIDFSVELPGEGDEEMPSYCHHMYFNFKSSDMQALPGLGETTVSIFNVSSVVESTCSYIDGDETSIAADDAEETGGLPTASSPSFDSLLVYADLKPLRDTFEQYKDETETSEIALKFKNAQKLYADIALADATVVFPYDALVSGGFLASDDGDGAPTPAFCVYQGPAAGSPGCTGCTGCAYTDCTGCTGCTGCMGSSGCTGCTVSTGCTSDTTADDTTSFGVSGGAGIVTQHKSTGTGVRTIGATGNVLYIAFHDGLGNQACVTYDLLWCAQPSFTVKKPFVYISDTGVIVAEPDADNFVNGRNVGDDGTAYDFSIASSDISTVKHLELYEMVAPGGMTGGSLIADFSGTAGSTDSNAHIAVRVDGDDTYLTYTRLGTEARASRLKDYRIDATVSEAFEADNLVLLEPVEGSATNAMLALTTAAEQTFTASQMFTLVDRSYVTMGITGSAPLVHMTNFNENNSETLTVTEGVTCSNPVGTSGNQHVFVDSTPEDSTTGLLTGPNLRSYNVVAYNAAGLFHLSETTSLVTARDTYVLAIAQGVTGSVTWESVKGATASGSFVGESELGVEFYHSDGLSLGSVLFVRKNSSNGDIVVVNSGRTPEPSLSAVVAIATTTAPNVSWESWDDDAAAARYSLTVLQVTDDVLDAWENSVTTNYSGGVTGSGKEDGEADDIDRIVVHVDTYSIWLTRAAAIESFVFGHYASGLTGSALLHHEIPDATRLGIRDNSLQIADGCPPGGITGENSIRVVYSLRARLETVDKASDFSSLEIGNPGSTTNFQEFAASIADRPWLELSTNVDYTSSTNIVSYTPITIGELKSLLYGPTGGSGLRIAGGGAHTVASGNDVRAWPERLWPSGTQATRWENNEGFVLRYRLYLQTPARLRSDYFKLSTSYSEVVRNGVPLPPGFDHGTGIALSSDFNYFSVYFKAYSTTAASASGLLRGSIRNDSTDNQVSDMGMRGTYVERESLRDSQATEIGKYFANYEVPVSKSFSADGIAGASFDTRYITTFDTLARGRAGDTEVVYVTDSNFSISSGSTDTTIAFPVPFDTAPLFIQVEFTAPLLGGFTSSEFHAGNVYVSQITKDGFNLRLANIPSEDVTGVAIYKITKQVAF